MVNSPIDVIQDDFLEIEQVESLDEPLTSGQYVIYHRPTYEEFRREENYPRKNAYHYPDMYIDEANMEYRLIHYPVQPIQQNSIKRKFMWNRPSTSKADEAPPILEREDFVESEPFQPETSKKRKAEEETYEYETEIDDEAYYNMSDHFDQGDMYIQQLVERASGSLMPNIDRKVGNSSFEAILKRLSMRRDCDVRKISCLVPMCGRVFESLQALAFHLSYAHIDVSANSKKDTICLVCGIGLVSSKAKVAHLSMKHRDLATIHSQNCVQQQDVVIAPGAPMAKRIEYKQTKPPEKKLVLRTYKPEKEFARLPHGYYIRTEEVPTQAVYTTSQRLQPIKSRNIEYMEKF